MNTVPKCLYLRNRLLYLILELIIKYNNVKLTLQWNVVSILIRLNKFQLLLERLTH